MKGLTHFMTGAAAASFFGGAMQMAAQEKSFIMLLGGAFGILPDTLDFKLGQFIAKADYEVSPDDLKANAQKLADAIGKAMDQAWEENREVRVQLHTVRLGADLWRQYVLNYDTQKNEISVVLNPIVTTSKIPYLGTEPKENRVGIYKIKGKFAGEGWRPTVVDIMSGPQLGFQRTEDGLIMEFIPWHRTWTHSFPVGLSLAAVVALLASIFVGWNVGWYYGLLAFVSYSAHLIEDVTGHLGAVFFWPFYKKRSRGLKLGKAQNPHINFLVDYTCLVIIIFNMNRFSLDPVFPNTSFLGIPWGTFFLYSLVIPYAVYYTIVKIFGERVPEEKEAVVLAEEAVSDYASEITGDF